MTIPDSEIAGENWRVLRREDGSLWELGRGALGVTYKGVNLHTDEFLAIKVVPDYVLVSSTARNRFHATLRVTARFLARPHSPRIVFVERRENAFYYAAEFVAGETLMSLVQRRGPLPPAEALAILLQAMRALVTLYDAFIVHRDIKPQNILLTPEEDAGPRQAELIDIGFAKVALERWGPDEETDGLHTTMRLATANPTYSSPEEIEGKPQGYSSDLYCLGLVLWFLLAGRPPFGGGITSIIVGHLQKPPPFEQFPAGQCPPPVRALLERLLAKDRAACPQDPAALCPEIESILAGLPRASRPEAE